MTVTAQRPRTVVGARTWTRWTCACRLVVTDVLATSAAYAAANDLMDEITAAIDTFTADSELNRLAAGTTPVSPLLASFLEVALRAAADTDGLVSPTATGPAPEAWRDISVRDGVVTLPAGARLDLGATGKAHAADLVAARVQREFGCGVLVGLGGDLASRGGPSSGWQIDVQDHPDDPAAGVSLAAGGAVATSSTVHRRRDGSPDGGHHVVDPRTGRSGDGPWRTVTVAAPTCVAANTASTAALVLGDDAPEWIADTGLAARLVARDGRILTLNGFPEEANR
ncbi:FAD:protein FMN transferase [Spongisporangium articulatum]|uniref:FAD:protein FMN transferase n=1 Tax=Spongisporangium articulatum TaxID=3362603 RepID=A0ABW8AR37_9ACTN